jgi:hypothetical protein
VFWKKRLEVVENKRLGCGKEGEEMQRGGKRKEVKEIEEVKEVEGENLARFVRDNTRDGTIYLDVCQ